MNNSGLYIITHNTFYFNDTTGCLEFKCIFGVFEKNSMLYSWKIEQTRYLDGGTSRQNTPNIGPRYLTITIKRYYMAAIVTEYMYGLYSPLAYRKHIATCTNVWNKIYTTQLNKNCIILVT